MGNKKVIIIIAILFLSLGLHSQDFNYKFCVVQKDATNIAFEFTVCNNSATNLSSFSFVFNWPGISDVTVDNGLDVLKNGNNGTVELVKQSWAQPLNTGCNNKFTIRMKYELGMFPPTFGLLNGDTIPGITCYVPPSFENFKCKKDFSEACFVHHGKEIQLGEGTVRAWNSTRDVYIPTNRKRWAIGMAVGHAIFNNLVGFDCITVNEYFATAMQESSCGCDAGVTAPAWVTNAYNIQPLNYCADLTHGVAAGFFQEEYGTGWIELEKDIPCFIPTVSFDRFIIGSRFETQVIGKAYHDFNNISYWQYIKCWNPIDFFKNAKDPYAAEKIIALGYNRGLNSGEIGNLLTTNRTAALAATNILPFLNPGGVGWVYAEQISRMSAVLDNNMGAIDPADPIASSVPFPGVHQFRDFYDTPVSWSDINNYIDTIAPMYAGVGLNATAFKSKVQAAFNAVKGGADLSFRYELSSVIDAIALNLPAFDPKFGLGGMYVNSGGSACKYPTAALSKSDTVCMGSPLTLTVKLTGTPPWSFSYQNPKGAIISLSGINTSPYIFTVPDTGIYQLVSVNDATGKGEAICEPVVKAYIGNGALADLITVSTIPCGPQSLQIKFTGSGPFDIEYTVDGITQAPVNGITQNPYTLIPATAPVATYVLTRLKANGCDIKMADTAIVHPLVNPEIAITGNKPICSGDSVLLAAQSSNVIATYNWLPTTGLSSSTQPDVKASPATTTTYVLTATDANGCVAKDSITLVVNPLPKITVSPDTAICPKTNAVLTVTGAVNYNWMPATGLNSTNDPVVIAAPLTTTQYTVEATDSNGCSAKDSVKLTINALPVLLVSSDTSICNTESTILTATGGVTYNWSPATGLNVTNTASVIASPITTTHYTVTAIDSNGCSAKDSVNVLVIACNFTATVKGGNVCKGNCFTLIASPVGGTGPYTYTWQPGTVSGDSIKVCPTVTTTYTVVITDKNGDTGQGTGTVTIVPIPDVKATNGAACKDEPITLVASGASTYSWSTGAATTAITVSPITTTSYTVTGSNPEGCTDTAIATAFIKLKPTANFTADTAGCVPLVVKFTNTSTQMLANATCLWDFGNGMKSQNCDPNPVSYTTSGIYPVSLTIDNEGCKMQITRSSITAYALPNALFTADPKKTDLFNPTISFTKELKELTKNTWTFGDGTTVTNAADEYRHTYKEEGTYHVCLDVSNINNCVDQHCLDVIITPGWSFYIPNAFTPANDDVLNAVFNAKGENITEYQLLIFDRWGNLLFQSNSLSEGWDGKMKNGVETAKQDVYVYKVNFRDASNKMHEYIGSVTLVK